MKPSLRAARVDVDARTLRIIERARPLLGLNWDADTPTDVLLSEVVLAFALQNGIDIKE